MIKKEKRKKDTTIIKHFPIIQEVFKILNICPLSIARGGQGVK